MLYNFPALTNGIDLDSDLIVDVVKEAPNICGVKLTYVAFAIEFLNYNKTNKDSCSCANVGKLTRIMAILNSAEFQSAYPRKYPEIPFRAIDGFIDFLLPSIPVGSSGAISGLPNIAPVSVLSITEICFSLTITSAENLRQTMGCMSRPSRSQQIPGSAKATKHHLPGGRYCLEDRSKLISLYAYHIS